MRYDLTKDFYIQGREICRFRKIGQGLFSKVVLSCCDSNRKTTLTTNTFNHLCNRKLFFLQKNYVLSVAKPPNIDRYNIYFRGFHNILCKFSHINFFHTGKKAYFLLSQFY